MSKKIYTFISYQLSLFTIYCLFIDFYINIIIIKIMSNWTGSIENESGDRSRL